MVIRQTGQSQLQYALQGNVMRGFLKMIDIFEKEFLVELKNINQLEMLINFIAKESALQVFSTQEPLASLTLLDMLTNEVRMAATFTNRSAGEYGQFLLYFGDK